MGPKDLNVSAPGGPRLLDRCHAELTGQAYAMQLKGSNK